MLKISSNSFTHLLKPVTLLLKTIIKLLHSVEINGIARLLFSNVAIILTLCSYKLKQIKKKITSQKPGWAVFKF